MIEVFYLAEKSELDEGPFLKEERFLIDEITKRLGGIIELKHVEQDQKLLERQLVQSQKMESDGQLTGGIAHDFNNLLAIIQGILELLERSVGDNGKASHHLGKAMSSVHRGASLTQRLLTFSRKQILKSAPIDLNSLIKGHGRYATPDSWGVD